jgi:hypothetical protein
LNEHWHVAQRKAMRHDYGAPHGRTAMNDRREDWGLRRHALHQTGEDFICLLICRGKELSRQLKRDVDLVDALFT